MRNTALTISAFAAALATPLLGAQGHQQPPAHGVAHWEYSGPHGPAHWSEVDEKFGTCATGKTQSPIDIRSADVTVAKLAPIKFDYKPSPLRIIDNGHTIQVNYAPGSSITVADKRYELLQFHFHKPSEERLNGDAYVMVAHLVHRSEAGKLAVVAVLLEKGEERPLIETIWNNLPKEKGVETTALGINIDINAMLPRAHAYYTFSGSLTTPPCSEGVTWFVMKNAVQLSAEQIERFDHSYAMNARPVQPLNGRSVQASE